MYIDNIGHIVRCKPYYADIMQYHITHASKFDIVLCMSYGISIGNIISVLVLAISITCMSYDISIGLGNISNIRYIVCCKPYYADIMLVSYNTYLKI